MNTMKADVVVSNWANWLAVDSNGSCFEYSVEPKESTTKEMWVPDNQRGQWGLLYKGKPPKDFKQELYTWK